MGEQQSLDFGADINATPLSNLQMPAVMTSRSDPGAPPPVTPPVYNPKVDLPDTRERRVRFDDRVEYSEPKHYRKDRRARHRDTHPVVTEKKKRLFRFLQDYRRQMTVFLLTFAFVWYYPSLLRMQYIGNAQSLTVIGLIVVPLAMALIFSGIEYILD